SHPLYPAAGRHGPRRHRQSHGHVVGSDPLGVPPTVVDLIIEPFQSRRWSERLPGHHHLRCRTDRGNAYSAHRDARRSTVGLALGGVRHFWPTTPEPEFGKFNTMIERKTTLIR